MVPKLFRYEIYSRNSFETISMSLINFNSIVDSLKNKIIQYFYKAKKFLANFYFYIKTKITLLLKIDKINNFDSEQTKFDKKLIYSLSKSKIPSLKQIKYIKKILSPKETWLLKSCLLIIFLSLLFLGFNFRRTHLQIVPIAGGEYTEGLVGVPKYINPLYASTSDVDNDISRLVFSSLFKRDAGGKLIKDLSKDYTVSEDNKIYTLTIRTDAKWHNNNSVTIDDIIFTFNAINNIQYKSPLRASFSGVNIEKIDNQTIRFILIEPYAAFLELLTFGIIPQNLWLQISPDSANLAELNLKSIGSGPYKFKSLIKDKSGNIRTYSLISNDNYYGQKPYIKNLTFKFFVNFEEMINALNENIIDGIGYLPRHAKDNLVAQDSLFFYNLNLPQITAIFFNQKDNSLLANKKIRQALALAINKNEIVSDVFGGEIRLIDGPILPNNFAYNKDAKKYKFDLETATRLIDEAGWKKIDITDEDITQAETDKESEDENIKQIANDKLTLGLGPWRKKENKYLIINLTTVETNDNIEVVELIKKFWEQIGVKTILNIVPTSQIQSEIIKPRNFEALFYGQVVGSDPDSYVFWHSSQIGEAGLNIANYANKKVDQLLEDARLTSDIEVRITKYKEFQDILSQDLPAIFMYSPIYTYVQSKKIKGFAVKNILAPYDRFANISEWYIKTGNKIIW